MPPRRGEIHWASVPGGPGGHAAGLEQHNEPQRPRLWLVVSSDRLNQRVGLFVACPLTTGVGASRVPADFRIEITADMIGQAHNDIGTPRDGLLLAEQVRVMSVERLAPVNGVSRHGMLKAAAQALVDSALHKVLDF